MILENLVFTVSIHHSKKGVFELMFYDDLLSPWIESDYYADCFTGTYQISTGAEMFSNIRIYHECEGAIENPS